MFYVRTFPDGLGIGLNSLSRFVPSMPGSNTLRHGLYRSGWFFGSGEINFRLPAADICNLTRSKVFCHSAVMGHFLRDLIRRFHFLHRGSPAFP